MQRSEALTTARIARFQVCPAIHTFQETETNDRHTAPRLHTGIRNPIYVSLRMGKARALRRLRSADSQPCSPLQSDFAPGTGQANRQRLRDRQRPRIAEIGAGQVIRSGNVRSGLSEERAETLLLEMGIVGQHIGDAFVTHGLHRNAVGQAVTLVQARAVKIQAC
jgi:hypothetical protein